MLNQYALMRIDLHQEAKIFFRQGDYFKSLEILNLALNSYGPHMGILADICFCYYNLNNLLLLKQSLKIFKSEYQKVLHELSEESKFKSVICIAKFLEEEGEVGSALKMYEEALTQFDPVLNHLSYYKTMAQIIRVKADFKISFQKNDQEYFLLLSNLKKDFPDFYFSTLIQHALLHADFFIYGHDYAESRLRSILKNDDNLNENDKMLLIFDFIEQCIYSKKNISHALIKDIKKFDFSLSHFQKEILLLATNPQYRLSVDTIITLESESHVADLLRILSAYLADKSSEQNYIISLKKKLEMTLQRLSKISQTMWRSKNQGLVKCENKNVNIVNLNMTNKELLYLDQSISLVNKKYILNLMNNLNGNQSLQNELIIDKIWGISYDLNSYERLRTTVRRANQILLKLTGQRNIIKITMEMITLNAPFKIAIAQ